MAWPAPVGDVQAGLGGFRIHLGAAVDNARRRIVPGETATLTRPGSARTEMSAEK